MTLLFPATPCPWKCCSNRSTPDSRAAPACATTRTTTACASCAEDDDSSLPTGVWQAEAKRADWAAVEQLASELLQRRSKDLMLAAWLGEAWLQRGGLGDCSARWCCWRNSASATRGGASASPGRRPVVAGAAHRLAVAPLCRAAAHAPAADGAGRVRRDHPLCLAEVAAPAGRQRRQQERQGGAGSGATSAEEARRSVARGALVQWQRKYASLLACQQQLQRLEQWCDRCLGELASSCQPLREVIAQWLALLKEFIAMHPQAPLSEEQPPVAEADASAKATRTARKASRRARRAGRLARRPVARTPTGNCC